MRKLSYSTLLEHAKRARPALLIAAMMVMVSACSTGTVSQHVDPYRPDVPSTSRTPWAWVAKLDTTSKPAAPPPAQQHSHVSPVAQANPETPSNQEPPPKPRKNGVKRRLLKSGDAVAITMLTTTEQITYQEEIDDEGHVVVRYLGDIEMASLTTSQAERLIERRLIEDGFFTNIDVIVLAEQVTYFIRGEVKAPGEYELARPKSLMQAISEAAGYTQFANEKKIYISRNNQKLDFNGKKIAQQEAEDPMIQGGDIIVVDHSILFR